MRGAGFLAISLATVFAGCAATGPRASSGGVWRMPEYFCVSVANPPKIDGQIDGDVWGRLTPVPLVLTNTGEPPRQPTTFRAVYDERALYIVFDCVDDDIWASIDEHDGDIFNEEVVEVFIDANRDSQTYFELEISPANVVLDMYILNPGPGKRFRGMRDFECEGIRTAVGVDGTVAEKAGVSMDDRGYVVEMALPFDQFPLAPNCPPKPGDRWRCNFYRIDRPAEGKGEYSAWSPTGAINYHMPHRFGELVFCP